MSCLVSQRQGMAFWHQNFANCKLFNIACFHTPLPGMLRGQTAVLGVTFMNWYRDETLTVNGVTCRISLLPEALVLAERLRHILA
jgi:hypothetical protein